MQYSLDGTQETGGRYVKFYYVYTQKICAELMLKGHKLIGVEPSKKREGYNVFSFLDSKKLQRDIEELITTKK